jgi:hypothetical protein
VGILARMQISTSLPAGGGNRQQTVGLIGTRAAVGSRYEDQRRRPLGARGLDHRCLASIVQFGIQHANIDAAFAQRGFGGGGIARFKIDRNRCLCRAFPPQVLVRRHGPNQHHAERNKIAAHESLRSRFFPLPAKTSPGNGDKLPLINTRDGFAIPQESIE